MNKTIIIGNLTRDPEKRVLENDLTCSVFTVAVNRRARQGQPQQADYFRVTAWRGLGDLCQQYLAKGRKVAVEGTIRAHAYLGNDGTARASLELTAENVEFVSPRSQQGGGDGYDAPPEEWTQTDDDELPFN